MSLAVHIPSRREHLLQRFSDCCTFSTVFPYTRELPTPPGAFPSSLNAQLGLERIANLLYFLLVAPEDNEYSRTRRRLC